MYAICIDFKAYQAFQSDLTEMGSKPQTKFRYRTH